MGHFQSYLQGEGAWGTSSPTCKVKGHGALPVLPERGLLQPRLHLPPSARPWSALRLTPPLTLPQHLTPSPAPPSLSSAMECAAPHTSQWQPDRCHHAAAMGGRRQSGECLHATDRSPGGEPGVRPVPWVPSASGVSIGSPGVRPSCNSSASGHAAPPALLPCRRCMYTRPHPSPVGGSSYCGVAQSIRAVAAARLELTPPSPHCRWSPAPRRGSTSQSSGCSPP